MLRTFQKWNQDYRPFKDGVMLVTIDVVGLYTNIPHQDLLTALRFLINSMSQTSIPPTKWVMEIANHVLSSNMFAFEDNQFQQTFGTALGTTIAPSAANPFVSWLESQLLANSPVPINEET